MSRLKPFCKIFKDLAVVAFDAYAAHAVTNAITTNPTEIDVTNIDWGRSPINVVNHPDGLTGLSDTKNHTEALAKINKGTRMIQGDSVTEIAD